MIEKPGGRRFNNISSSDRETDKRETNTARVCFHGLKKKETGRIGGFNLYIYLKRFTENYDVIMNYDLYSAKYSVTFSNDYSSKKMI